MKATLKLAASSLLALGVTPFGYGHVNSTINTQEHIQQMPCPLGVYCTKAICAPFETGPFGKMFFMIYDKILERMIVSEDSILARQICKGRSFFASANASYNSNNAIAQCHYNPVDGQGDRYVYQCKGVILTLNPLYNLTADMKASGSKWQLTKERNIDAACLSTNPYECQLTERNGFVIHNSTVNQGVRTAVNGVIFNSDIPVTGYSSRNYDQLLPYCKEKFCTVDILTLNSLKIGSIIFDMDSMQIDKVIPGQSNIANIRKVDSFNAVEITSTI